MTERDLQSLFTGWVKTHTPQGPTAWELKIEKGRAIPFNKVADHQIAALLGAKNGGVYHRIMDQPWIKGRPWVFSVQKPFDCFFICKSEAYVVILFYQPRKMKEIFFIDIEDWVTEKNTSSRKSLTIDRAREISKKIEIIKKI